MQAEQPITLGPIHGAVIYVDGDPDRRRQFEDTFGSHFPILLAASVAATESILDIHGGHIGVLVIGRCLRMEKEMELLELVRTHNPNITRVICVEASEKEDALASLHGGYIHRYVVEPWDIASLRAALLADLNRHRSCVEDLANAKRRAMAALAARINHEMATPFSTIRMLGSALEECLPALIEAYRRGLARGAPATVPEEMLDLLATAPESLLAVAGRANALLELLRANTREVSIDTGDYRLFSIRRCVDTALESYAYGEGEARLVQRSGGDFEILGSEELMTFVFHNLLKNALYAIRRARKGEVNIQILPGSTNHRLLFTDTGDGIPSEILPLMFDECLGSGGSKQGSGMGLPFCRRVIDAFGGDISCRSLYGELTEIELSFPRPEDRERTDMT